MPLRLPQINGWCHADRLSTKPFGVDPHFVETSGLHNANLHSLLHEGSSSSNGSSTHSHDHGANNSTAEYGAFQLNALGLPFGFIYPQVSITATLAPFNRSLLRDPQFTLRGEDLFLAWLHDKLSDGSKDSSSPSCSSPEDHVLVFDIS